MTASKRPAPKCPRPQTAVPKRRRPNGGAQKSRTFAYATLVVLNYFVTFFLALNYFDIDSTLLPQCEIEVDISLKLFVIM